MWRVKVLNVQLFIDNSDVSVWVKYSRKKQKKNQYVTNQSIRLCRYAKLYMFKVMSIYNSSIQWMDIQHNNMLTWFILHDGGIFKWPFHQKLRYLDKNISCMESAVHMIVRFIFFKIRIYNMCLSFYT